MSEKEGVFIINVIRTGGNIENDIYYSILILYVWKGKKLQYELLHEIMF